MRWRRYRMKVGKRTGMLLCIIRNQIAMMEAMKRLLEIHQHTAHYGTDYADILQYRIEACEKMTEL